MSSQAISSAAPSNLAADLKPQGTASAAVKPCCVCKDEKATRDECMLFSSSDNPQAECASMVDKYRSCMAGYGFKMG
ncbi:MAG: cytochrome c oxidase copper chaperone [Lasallia pustulata]|uniref:Cytochrome c oxidase copper chaperone n=1 Tax=Lasallia pustulata TaxID=136370 RepID=A0A5M8PK98_9LECA|nr:MAG: cytochrome c oxidase copper chaperone [Lasallia pustulata]